MKNLLLASLLLLTGCSGYRNTNVEIIGQVRSVCGNTPVFCPEYTDALIVVGGFNNGSGSVDVDKHWYNVTTPEQEATLRNALASNSLVKITYEIKRTAPCTDSNSFITKVELVN